jgi:hypothetical protein
MKNRLADIKNNLKHGVKPDLHTLSWLTSLQTRESGIWLDAIPTNPKYILKSSVFRFFFIHSLLIYKLRNKEIYSNPTKDLPPILRKAGNSYPL